MNKKLELFRRKDSFKRRAGAVGLGAGLGAAAGAGIQYARGERDAKNIAKGALVGSLGGGGIGGGLYANRLRKANKAYGKVMDGHKEAFNKSKKDFREMESDIRDYDDSIKEMSASVKRNPALNDEMKKSILNSYADARKNIVKNFTDGYDKRNKSNFPRSELKL